MAGERAGSGGDRANEIADEVRAMAFDLGYDILINEISGWMIVDVGRHSWTKHKDQDAADFWQKVLDDVKTWAKA